MPRRHNDDDDAATHTDDVDAMHEHSPLHTLRTQQQQQHHEEEEADESDYSSSDELDSDLANVHISSRNDGIDSDGGNRADGVLLALQQHHRAAGRSSSHNTSASAAARRSKSVSVRMSNSDDPCPPGERATNAAGVLELLHEELKLEIAPRKLLRQFSLNIPPSSTSIGPCETPSDYRSAILSHNVLQHASPNALGDVLERWEKNHMKWRHHGSSQSLAAIGGVESHAQSRDVAPLHAIDSRSESLSALVPSAAATNLSGPLDASALDSSVPVEPERVPFVRHETFDVRFDSGFLGIEFVIDETRSEVVVKSVQPGSGAWTVTSVQIPSSATLARGLIVDAINGRDVSAVAPAHVLDLLQFSPRPLVVRFRKAPYSIVVCKLCECKVDATSLDEHTNYCVMSKRFELEADQINAALTKLAASIDGNLHTDALRAYFHADDLHFFNALRVVAIQASSCDVTSVESFALCSRLLKIVDRIRQQEPETASCAVERGLKYCGRLRNLIHAKMSKMRATQKVMLQQAPSDVRAPFHRTKSLEEKDPSASALRPALAPRAPARLAACRVSIRDFQIIKPISKGAYGKVYLARKKTTGDQYAIKVLAKEHLLRKKQQIENIETERDILVNIESPYVVKLFWTFQSKRNLFLVMEYLPGGDFMSLLECIVQLEEQVARVYIAEVALALNHLHSKGCVHRDLKPDNILISSTGHIKLTDFGLSEEAVNLSDSESETANDGFFGDLDDTDLVSDAVPDRKAGESSPEQFGLDESISAFFDASRPPRRRSKKQQQRKKKQTHPHTYGRCGTPDYLSPEIILGIPHGPPVDYWALGIILYEMLVGFPPFNDDSVEAIFNNILERQILWPDGDKCLSPDAIDLISRLLEPDQTLRLDWHGLQRHAFFDGIDWDTLLDAIPPFVPTLEGPNDTSYFNNRNLTDIFIDDDDFDFDAKSLDSSSVADPHDATGAGDDVRSISGGESESDAQSVAALSISDTVSDSVSAAGGEQRPSASGLLRADASSSSSDAYGESMTYRFPSGMYGSPDDSRLHEAFRSFSFTNMNALAAASRTEAEMITDSRLLEVENSSALSILI